MVMSGLVEYGQGNASFWGIPGTKCQEFELFPKLSLFWRQSSMAGWKAEGRGEEKDVEGSILLCFFLFFF